MVYEGWLNNAS
ncbi:hypothetical protein SS209_02166 [Salmonella enterica subsp. enterica serovar Senftenberg str. SS209]|nr:hypothetical protein SS209_02166 [Salmonella enterica subsp. enterica serovar Senftenberg str. SS209]